MRIICFITIILIFGCKQATKSTVEQTGKPSRLDSFVLSFYNKFPEMKKKGFTEKAIQVTFQNASQAALSQGLLDSIPLTLRMIKQVGTNTYSVHFEHDKEGQRFDVIYFTDSTALKYDRSRKHYARGEYIGPLDQVNFQTLADHPANYERAEIKDPANFTLGIHMLQSK